MADQVSEQGTVQEDVNTPHADTILAGLEIKQEVENVVQALIGNVSGISRDPWDLLSGVRLDPISTDDKWSSLQKLTNLLSVFKVQRSQFGQHINRCNRLLPVVYVNMMNRHATLCNQTWLPYLSKLRMIVHDHHVQMEIILCSSRQTSLKDYMLANESLLTFLRRIAGDFPRVEEVKEALEAIKNGLESTQNCFREQFEQSVAEMEVHLASSTELSGLHTADSVWIRKAFRVLAKVQPSLDQSDVYIARWSYPDIDNVVKAEGLEL